MKSKRRPAAKECNESGICLNEEGGEAHVGSTEHLVSVICLSQRPITFVILQKVTRIYPCICFSGSRELRQKE